MLTLIYAMFALVSAPALLLFGPAADALGPRTVLRVGGTVAAFFQRSFVLADGVQVTAAQMENGLLHIDLTRVQPQQVVQTIPISRK